MSNPRFKWVPHLIRHDFLRKFFALLFAILVTATVYSEKRKSEVDSFLLNNVQPFLIADDGYVWRKDNVSTVTLRLRGPRNKMIDLKAEDFELKRTVGETEYKSNKNGKQFIRFSPADVRCHHPNAALIEVVEVQPNDYPLNISKIITKQLEISGECYDLRELPADYEVERVEFPETGRIRVTGPEHILKNIRQLTLEPISLKNHVADFTTVAKINPIQDLNLERTTLPVTIRINRLTRQNFADLSLGALLPPGKVTASSVEMPDVKVKVWVEGSNSVISELRPADLYPYVDLTRLSPGEKHMGVPVRCHIHKPGVSVTKIIPDKVDNVLISAQSEKK